MKYWYKLLGVVVMFFGLFSDLLVIAAMIALLWGNTKSISAWVIIGICCYLWFFGKNTKSFGSYNDRPFSGWKPSTMKAFWTNWNKL